MKDSVNVSIFTLNVAVAYIAAYIFCKKCLHQWNYGVICLIFYITTRLCANKAYVPYTANVLRGKTFAVFQPIAKVSPLNHLLYMQYMLPLVWCSARIFQWTVCFVHKCKLKFPLLLWMVIMVVPSINYYVLDKWSTMVLYVHHSNNWCIAVNKQTIINVCADSMLSGDHLFHAGPLEQEFHGE